MFLCIFPSVLLPLNQRKHFEDSLCTYITVYNISPYLFSLFILFGRKGPKLYVFFYHYPKSFFFSTFSVSKLFILRFNHPNHHSPGGIPHSDHHGSCYIFYHHFHHQYPILILPPPAPLLSDTLIFSFFYSCPSLLEPLPPQPSISPSPLVCAFVCDRDTHTQRDKFLYNCDSNANIQNNTL